MKRLLTIIAVASLALVAGSCAVPDEDYVHDDATISAIYISTTQKDATGKEKNITFAGVVTNGEDGEMGEVLFTIPKEKRKQIDLDAVKIRANVGFDAYVKVTKEGGKDVDRTLYGIHDITEGIYLTVTARMTGRTKDYHLAATIKK